ncbi:hypothetical protein M409DRAFT_20822 [Zasmidium cellare ATCC 36951]|uniref:Aminoglycoside phosphotransferase domain-containing protein n=1 Tax=Zasmidium cellare ATCC 36951 TaxID=1080233 RepID=A0A6A6CNX7_ZASCE|nr:uncharacterized protein M409DRAFT_20822 [Zasmidium cellare ATCC 36951]KAF2168805.1 hypothetical protein M409DRAFT_20822 [Zasmidium cellare ATCC 36951]
MENDDESSRSSGSSNHSNTEELEEPTIEAVQIAARKALNPDHDIACRRFAEGTHHAVYAIGDDHVARCLPISEKAIKSLRRDGAVQNLAKRSMSKPDIVSEVLETPLIVDGWQGNLERRLHGICLQDSQPTAKTEADLAQLLIDLRAVDVGEALAATAYQESKVNIKARVGKTIRAWEELVQKGHAVDPEAKLSSMLKEKLEGLSKVSEGLYQPALLHADINTENVLVDPKDGSITGVLDWSDAFVGDPCVEFSGVIFAIGVEGARRVGEKVGLSAVEIERGWLYTMTEMIRDLRKCLCGEKRDEHLTMLLKGEWGRVFEGTGFEGLLRSERSAA